ncbi:SRPBCC family protein [Actinacidiphila glaucinigra]|uniref:SRPBCC family protein n=1 Tax=Actinacidiphila glaucinigra TaxID=235986 RepID=UPI0037C9C3DE
MDAPVAEVWRLISDLRACDTWRSDARVVELGAVEPDARFRWRLRGTLITSSFAVVAPERELSWTGVAMGWMKAVDRMRMAPAAAGRSSRSRSRSPGHCSRSSTTAHGSGRTTRTYFAC